MRFSNAIFLAVLVFVAPAAIAQTPSDPTPTLKVYSRETVVDVTVTDAKGRPVHGLMSSDFTVEEDGNVQSIRMCRRGLRMMGDITRLR